MSKNNGHTTPPYISRVRLKGYKSILDTEIDLHSGLNIIIGPNGSGKTNFLELLSRMFRSDFPEREFEAIIEFFIGDNFKKWKVQRKKITFNSLTEEALFPKVVQKIFQKGDRKPFSNDIKEIIDTNYRITYIPFEFPRDIVGLHRKLSLEISRNDFVLNINGISSYIRFINNFIFLNFFGHTNQERFLKDRELLLERLIINDEIKRNLRKFTPIEDIRIDEGFTIKTHTLIYTINFEFEFKIGGIWMNWSKLSDGTKRLFYIITEVTLNNGICFVEEPEIGVHPNQYLKILTFLRESGEDKQVIVTTHAPRTLDILKDKELNRIILTRYDQGQGTKMRHLSKKEIKQAIKYREDEGSTSELWSYTGFFDEEEVI